jgi:hypothetical protein
MEIYRLGALFVKVPFVRQGLTQMIGAFTSRASIWPRNTPIDLGVMLMCGHPGNSGDGPLCRVVQMREGGQSQNEVSRNLPAILGGGPDIVNGGHRPPGEQGGFLQYGR